MDTLAREPADTVTKVVPSEDSEKPRLILPAPRFVGDQPYSERTFWRLKRLPQYNHDRSIADKTSTVGRAIDGYVPSNTFDQWVNTFVGSLDRPSHKTAVMNSLTVYLPAQLNMWDRVDMPEPGMELYASAESIRSTLEELYHDLYTKRKASSDKIADLRHLLSMSEFLDQTPEHPDLVLALALYQAAHEPYLHNLQTRLHTSYLKNKIEEEQWNNARSVMEGPFEQFNGFLLLAPFLSLTFMARDDVAQKSGPQANLHAVTEEALRQAGEMFIKSRLLMTKFSDTETAICPARHHIYHAIRSGLLIGLYRFVTTNAEHPLIQNLLDTAQRSAYSAVQHKAFNYRRFKGGPSAETYYRKENSILRMAMVSNNLVSRPA